MIAKEKLALRQVVGYRELALLFEFYHEFEIVVEADRRIGGSATHLRWAVWAIGGSAMRRIGGGGSGGSAADRGDDAPMLGGLSRFE